MSSESELTICKGRILLRGRSEYGDSIEDEWVIVWLLRELTKRFSNLWVKASDSDGEFLLIEASGTLPAWLEPEIADNRVWIHDGKLMIIKLGHGVSHGRPTDENLSLDEAQRIIMNDPRRLMHSISIEEEAFFRLRNYPNQISKNQHHAVVKLPRKIAHLLHQKPSYVAVAVEAFYLRDPISLKLLQSGPNDKRLVFPPEDLVVMSVQFPRVGYAQLKSQEFRAPSAWNPKMPSKSDQASFMQAETGMKLTCGFEILLSDLQHQDTLPAREIKMLLEDLESGDATLPSDTEISRWEITQDSEEWLDISFEDLEHELEGREHTRRGQGPTFNDKSAQENLQRIVKQFEDFLNDKKAGLDGADLLDEESDSELDSSDSDEDDEGEDKEATFDEDQFTRMMREMMGMPPEVMDEMMHGELKVPASKPVNASEQGPASLNPADGVPSSRLIEIENSDASEEAASDNGIDLQSAMEQIEVELKTHGALNLDLDVPTISAPRRSTTGNGVSRDSETSSEEGNSDDHVNVNLARNLLESFKAQAGQAGPSGNLMGLMGFKLPRDEIGDMD